MVSSIGGQGSEIGLVDGRNQYRFLCAIKTFHNRAKDDEYDSQNLIIKNMILMANLLMRNLYNNIVKTNIALQKQMCRGNVSKRWYQSMVTLPTSAATGSVTEMKKGKLYLLSFSFSKEGNEALSSRRKYSFQVKSNGTTP